MADRRIRIDSDKVTIVDDLAESSGDSAPFSLRADAIAFAAALGFRKGKPLPLAQPAKDPIRLDVFSSHNYATLINLLAVCHTQDPKVLAASDAAEDRRATVFEEYANGGLHILRENLKGLVDGGSRMMKIVQLIAEMRQPSTLADSKELDINDLVV